jgi:selenide,water dikinase
VLSINIGSAPRVANAEVALHSQRLPVVPVKPIDGFGRRWGVLLEKIAALDFAARKNGPARNKLRVAVVGGGAGGVELVLSMQYRIGRELQERGIISGSLGSTPDAALPATRQFFRELGEFLEVSLVTRSATLLPTHSTGVARIFCRILRERNVRFLPGKAVMDVEATDVEHGVASTKVLKCADGSSLPFDECVWCTQARPSDSSPGNHLHVRRLDAPDATNAMNNA